MQEGDIEKNGNDYQRVDSKDNENQEENKSTNQNSGKIEKNLNDLVNQ